MRLIDADALMAQLNTEVSEIALKEREEYGIDLTASDIGTEYATLMKKVLQAPTIDAAEVVRCKDCKRSDWYKTLNGEHRCYCMEHGSSGHTDDDYCSYGEREDGE